MRPVSDEMPISSLEQFLGVWQIINIDERELVTTHILLLGKNAFKDIQLGQKAGFIVLEQYINQELISQIQTWTRRLLLTL
jgi:hypothetical protein